MPWTTEKPPKVAQSWTEAERRRCVAAANRVLADTGDEAQAVFACIHAAGKGQAEEDKMLEYKSVPFELTKVDEGGRSFEGYASMFRDPTKDDPDHTGDMVCKGAFKRTIAERGHKVRMLWQHDPGQPIGRFTELREDDRGLFVKGTVSDTRLGRDALTLLKDRAIDSMSIGYDVAGGGADWGKTKSGASIRLLKEVRLWEVSLVTFPADEAAKVTALKEQPKETPPEPSPPPALAKARTQAKSRIDSALDGAIDDALAALETARLLSEAAKAADETKAGRRLSAATVSKLEAAMQALKDLMGVMPHDDEDEEDMPPKPMKPMKSEDPPVAEAPASAEQAGPDSAPEAKAGDAATPPTETSVGPDADSPTSSEVRDAESADPTSEIARQMAEVKALLDWR